MEITCEALRKWLEKMPEDANIRFALDGLDNSQETLQFKDCFLSGRTYQIILEREQ